jgi:type I protein arginine methyltransferase
MLFRSHAQPKLFFFLGPFSPSLLNACAALYQSQLDKAEFWTNTDYYGLDISPLYQYAVHDHFSQPVVGCVHSGCATFAVLHLLALLPSSSCCRYVDPNTLISNETASLTIDFVHDDPGSLHVMSLPFDFVANQTGLCHGIAAWFDVTFSGTSSVTVLPTGPSHPGTHWYQTRLLLSEPLAVNVGQRITGVLRMVANDQRSFDLDLEMSLPGSEHAAADGLRVSAAGEVVLQDQLYFYD